MRTNSLVRRRRREAAGAHRGMASLEVVMTVAVMLPIAGALLLLGIQMCKTLYQAIGTLVSWPFL